MKHSKDYQNQEMGEVIKEVRRIRHEISVDFGHDPHKFGEYCRELEKELRKLGKYKFAKSPEEESKSPKPTGVEAAD